AVVLDPADRLRGQTFQFRSASRRHGWKVPLVALDAPGERVRHVRDRVQREQRVSDEVVADAERPLAERVGEAARVELEDSPLSRYFHQADVNDGCVAEGRA